MPLEMELLAAQQARWPQSGRVILAQFDSDSVVVYQAYCPETGRFAAEHGRFGPGFSLNRMTWVKPNFLWMMYRSGWGTKLGQEVTLAIRVRRTAFDELLWQAVPSSFDARRYESRQQWQQAVAESEVRLQWDPDHGPHGEGLERRAIQLGLRGSIIESYVSDWIVSIHDISAYVAEQRSILVGGSALSLMTPREQPYPVADAGVAQRLGLPFD